MHLQGVQPSPQFLSPPKAAPIDLPHPQRLPQSQAPTHLHSEDHSGARKIGAGHLRGFCLASLASPWGHLGVTTVAGWRGGWLPQREVPGSGGAAVTFWGLAATGGGHGEDRSETVIERSRLKISKIGEGHASSGSGSSVKTGQDMRQDMDTESKGEVLSAAGEGRAAPVTSSARSHGRPPEQSAAAKHSGDNRHLPARSGCVIHATVAKGDLRLAKSEVVRPR